MNNDIAQLFQLCSELKQSYHMQNMHIIVHDDEIVLSVQKQVKGRHKRFNREIPFSAIPEDREELELMIRMFFSYADRYMRGVS